MHDTPNVTVIVQYSSMRPTIYFVTHSHAHWPSHDILLCEHSYASAAADDAATSSDMPAHGGGASDGMAKSNDRRRKEVAVVRVLLYLGAMVGGPVCIKFIPHTFLINVALHFRQCPT